jgi:metal-responsive CopG/Arc/MetJ family transcriptional regulator
MLYIIIAIIINIKVIAMKTVQMTLDDGLVSAVDRVVRKLHTSRSAFTREALRQALHRAAVAAEERRHRQGYERHPVGHDEFSVWEKEQDWGDHASR